MRLFALALVSVACSSLPVQHDVAASTDGGAADVSRPCLTWSVAEEVARVEVDKLDEASGLAASAVHAGVLYAVNDSGNAPKIFAFDLQGRALHTWRVGGVVNEDWEDLAVAPCAPGETASCLYIADTGDNAAVRDVVRILVVPEPAFDSAEELAVLRTVTFRYPGGPRDCESLLVTPDSGLFVVAKRPVPERDMRGVFAVRGAVDGQGVITAERVGDLRPTEGPDALYTGGSVHPSGRRLVLRTYAAIEEYVLPEGAPFESFSSQPARVVEPGGAAEIQGESISYGWDSLWTTSEGSRPPLNRRSCLEREP